MPKVYLLIFISLLLTSVEVCAEKKYASPNDGFRLNQHFVQLEDGTFYAIKDKKVIRANQILSPEEAAEIREQTVSELTRFRYWESGSPPEKNAAERFAERKELVDEKETFNNLLAQENWLLESKLHEEPEKKG